MRGILTSRSAAVNTAEVEIRRIFAPPDSPALRGLPREKRHLYDVGSWTPMTTRHALIHLGRAAPLAAAAAVAAGCGCGSGIASAGDASAHAAASATLASAMPPVVRPFAVGGVWNAPLRPNLRISSTSRAIVAELAREARDERARGVDPRVDASTTLSIVPPGRPLVSVRLVDHRPDAALQRAWRAVPLPADAVPSAGSDHELTVWQPSADRLWEFWHLARSPTGGWQAQWGGAMSRVHANPGYFSRAAWPGAKRYWGATATSLPLLGGLIRTAELQRGEIDHALAFAVPNTHAWLYRSPAQRTDGVSFAATSLPEGTRLRLDPALDVTRLNLPAPARAIARAAQRYGIVVRDTSPRITFYAEAPAGGVDPLGAYPAHGPSQLLAGFPWDRLQVIAGTLSGRR
jgi:hypothetical protein